jgi:hypothetical protein
MQQNTVLEMAKDGQPKAIAALLTRSIGNAAKVQAIFQEDILLIKTAGEESLEQTATTETIQKVLVRLGSPKISACKVEAYSLSNKSFLWSEEFVILDPSVEEEIPMDAVPDLAAEDASEAVPTEVIETGELPLQSKGWSFPGVKLDGFNKVVASQVAQQAVKLAQDTATNTHGIASKATEQALRSSIDQTMGAFQIAVEQIRERRLPAKMAALTGTINAGIIQLSITLDIPMDEETGDIAIEAKRSDEQSAELF